MKMNFKEFLNPRVVSEATYTVEEYAQCISVKSPKTGKVITLHRGNCYPKELSEVIAKINKTPGSSKQVTLLREDVVTFMKFANESLDFKVLQGYLTNFINSHVMAEIKAEFDPKAKIDITRNIINGKQLSVQLQVRGPWQIEASDLDSAWEKVQEIIREKLQDFDPYGYSLDVTILKRNPAGALFGITIK